MPRTTRTRSASSRSSTRSRSHRRRRACRVATTRRSALGRARGRSRGGDRPEDIELLIAGDKVQYREGKKLSTGLNDTTVRDATVMKGTFTDYDSHGNKNRFIRIRLNTDNTPVLIPKSQWLYSITIVENLSNRRSLHSTIESFKNQVETRLQNDHYPEVHTDKRQCDDYFKKKPLCKKTKKLLYQIKYLLEQHIQSHPPNPPPPNPAPPSATP